MLMCEDRTHGIPDLEERVHVHTSVFSGKCCCFNVTWVPTTEVHVGVVKTKLARKVEYKNNNRYSNIGHASQPQADLPPEGIQKYVRTFWFSQWLRAGRNLWHLVAWDTRPPASHGSVPPRKNYSAYVPAVFTSPTGWCRWPWLTLDNPKSTGSFAT